MMHNRKKLLIPMLGAVVAVLAALFVVSQGKDTPESAPTPTPDVATSPSPSPAPTPAYKTLRAADVKAEESYVFSAEIPNGWEAEPAESGESIAIYDPAASGASNLEKAQIFVRHFHANDFLTLQTVTIYSRTTQTVNNRPAVRYDIEKRPNVANFANQPTWRSVRHMVTDVRVSAASPSAFYVFAKNPSLSDDVFNNFLNTLQVVAPAATPVPVDTGAVTPASSLAAPVADFASRITKKKFGQYITPANSPVQPERFSGYHTGVDIEYADVAGDVSVAAVTDGKVIASRTVDGYGGVVAIQHSINGQNYIGLYGHVDPKTMIANGTTVTKGQKIAVLGDDKSTETDGERKHLHFSVIKGTSLILSGYVQNQSELSKWVDPLSLY